MHTDPKLKSTKREVTGNNPESHGMEKSETPKNQKKNPGGSEQSLPFGKPKFLNPSV
jgi:hypothetical protein